MAMLAEPRRRQRWSMNPRGSLWANDNQKFGQKLMEKMGWSKGKGLGREEQGQTEHITVRCKDDNKGLGYKGKDDEWIKHYEGFENVLAMLNSEHNSAANSKTNSASNSSAVSDEETEEKDLKSLEARSKVSRARVHYHKFTRGKDLSRYNDDDIACILGSKRAKILAKAKSVEESTSIVDEVGHVDKLNGVTTIKGCSVQDYFAQKMAASKNKVLTELPAEENMEEDKQVVRETLGINVGINSSNEGEETHSRDHKTFRTKKGNKRKCKSSSEDRVEVEECCQKKQKQELSNEKESLSPKLKYKKINNSFDRGNVEDVSVIRNKTIIDEDEWYMKHGKKRKKCKKSTEKVVSQESDIGETVAGNKKKRKKAKCLENEGYQFPERNNIEQLEKSVKKKKKKLNCRDQSEKQEINQTNIFISDAANAESHGRKKKKKSRKNIAEQSEGNTEVTNYKDGNIPNDLHQIKISDKEKGKINNQEEQDKEKKEQASLEDVETELKKQKENSHLLCDQSTANFNDQKNTIWLDLDVITFSESSIYPEARESLEIRSKRRSKNSLEIINEVNGIHKLFRKNPDSCVEDLGAGIDENRLSDSSSVMNSKTKSTRLDFVERTVVNPESKAEKEGCVTHSCRQSDMKCLEGDQGYVEDRVTNKQYELASSNTEYVNEEKVKSKCVGRNGTSIDIEFRSGLKENFVNSNYGGKFCSNIRKDAIIMAKSELKTKKIHPAAEAFKGANLWDCRGHGTKARQEALEDVVPEGQLKNYYLKPIKKEFIKNSYLLCSKNIGPEKKKNWLPDNVMNLAESRVCPGRKSKILGAVGAQAFKGANLWQCKSYETKATKETLGGVEPERNLKHDLKPKKKEFTKNKKNQNQLHVIENVTTLSESRACPEYNDPSENCRKQRKSISDINSKLSIINKMFRIKLDNFAKDISNKNISHENNFMGSETKNTPLDCIEKNKKVVCFKSTSDRGESSADSCWGRGIALQVHKVDQVNVAAQHTIKHESSFPNTKYVTKEVRSKCDTRIQNNGNQKQFMHSEYESCMNVHGMNRTSVGKFCMSKNYLRNNEILSGALAFKGANLWQYRGYDS